MIYMFTCFRNADLLGPNNEAAYVSILSSFPSAFLSLSFSQYNQPNLR